MCFTQGCASTQESGEGAGKLELARLFFFFGRVSLGVRLPRSITLFSVAFVDILLLRLFSYAYPLTLLPFFAVTEIFGTCVFPGCCCFDHQEMM